MKTLHPKVHAAILARRGNEKHMAELKAQGIEPIELVAANLYPFREAAASGASGDALLEKIDIGGVTLLRAAAKNHSDVIVLSRPERYGPVLEELRERGSVSVETAPGRGTAFRVRLPLGPQVVAEPVPYERTSSQTSMR